MTMVQSHHCMLAKIHVPLWGVLNMQHRFCSNCDTIAVCIDWHYHKQFKMLHCTNAHFHNADTIILMMGHGCDSDWVELEYWVNMRVTRPRTFHTITRLFAPFTLWTLVVSYHHWTFHTILHNYWQRHLLQANWLHSSLQPWFAVIRHTRYHIFHRQWCCE